MFSDITRLFASPLRLKVLKFFALQRTHSFVLNDVPRLVGGSKDKVKAEIHALTRAGLLTARHRSKKEGTEYQWQPAHPLSLALIGFVEAATVPKDYEIIKLFKRLQSVVAVITAGTLVHETRSSLDLLIVSRNPQDTRIAAAIKRLEGVTAMPIRFAVMSPREFEDRRETYDRLVRDVLDFTYKVVCGRIAGL